MPLEFDFSGFGVDHKAIDERIREKIKLRELSRQAEETPFDPEFNAELELRALEIQKGKPLELARVFDEDSLIRSYFNKIQEENDLANLYGGETEEQSLGSSPEELDENMIQAWKTGKKKLGITGGALIGVEEGLAGMPLAGGAGLSMIGDWGENVARNLKFLTYNAVNKLAPGYYEKRRQPSVDGEESIQVNKKNLMQSVGREAYDYYKGELERIQQDYPSHPFTKDLAFLKDPVWWSRSVAQTVTSLAGQAALGGGTGWTAALTGAGMEALPNYEELKDQDLSNEDAVRRAVTFGLMVTAFEKRGLDKMFKWKEGAKTAGQKLGKVVTGALGEGLSEATEEPADALTKYLGRLDVEPTRLGEEVMKSVEQGVMVFFPAALTGGGSAALTTLGYPDKQRIDVTEEGAFSRRNLYKYDPEKKGYTIGDGKLLDGQSLRDLFILNSPNVSPAEVDLSVGIIEANAESRGQTLDEFVKENFSGVNKGTEGVTEQSLEQPTYHGTAQVFNEFDTSKIGTGQGAQSFGWGIYVAEAKGVAESIERQLRRKADSNVIWTDPKTGTSIDLSSPIKEAESLVEEALQEVKNTGSVEQAIENLKSPERIALFNVNYKKDLITWLEEHKDQIKIESPGHMLQVELDDTKKDRFLVLDKPLDEQSPFVQNALAKYDVFSSDMTGDEIYKKITQEFASQKDASLYLLKLGILGNQYLDQGSRIAEHRFNYNKESKRWTYSPSVPNAPVYSAKTKEKIIEQLEKLPKTYNYVLFDPKQVVKEMKRLYQETGEDLKFTSVQENLLSWAIEAMDKETLSETLEREVSEQEVKDLEEHNWKKVAPDILEDLKYRLIEQLPDMEGGQVEDLLEKGKSVKGAEAGARSTTRAALATWDKIEKSLGVPDSLSQSKKGATTFQQDSRALISLFQKADLSTLLHEHSHVLFKGLSLEQLRTIAKWSGVSERALQEFKANPYKALNGKYAEEIIIAQEKWADGFEKYLLEGKAPTPKMRKLFELAKTFLRKLYLLAGNEKISKIKIPPDVRAVYDSLFITEKERFGGKIVSDGGTYVVEKEDDHAVVKVQAQGREFSIRVDNLITGKKTSISKDREIIKSYLQLQRDFFKKKARWISPLERTDYNIMEYEWDKQGLEALDRNGLEIMGKRLGIREANLLSTLDLETMILEKLRLDRQISKGMETTLAVDKGSLLTQYKRRILTALTGQEDHIFRGALEFFFEPLLEAVRLAGGNTTTKMKGEAAGPMQQRAYEKGLEAFRTAGASRSRLSMRVKAVKNRTNGGRNPLSKKARLVVKLRSYVDQNGVDQANSKEKVFYSVLHKAIVEESFRKTLDKDVQEAVEEFMKLVTATGLEVEKSGALITILEDVYDEDTHRWRKEEKEVPFKANRKGDTFERLLTSEFLYALRQPNPAIRIAVSRHLVKLPGNEHLSENYILHQLESLGNSSTRRSHMEFQRRIPNVPTAIELEGGLILQLLHTEAFYLAEQMANQTANFVGFRAGFGNTKESSAFLENFGDLTHQKEVLATLYKALNGIPLWDDRNIEPGGPKAILGDIGGALISLWKVGKLSLAAAVNVPETMRLPAFASSGDYLKALRKVLVPLLKFDKNALLELENTLGMVANLSDTIPNYIIRKDAKYFLRDLTTVAGRGWLRLCKVTRMNSLNEIIAAAMGDEMIKRFKQGKGSEWDRYRLTLLKFSEEDIKILLDSTDKNTDEYNELAMRVIQSLPILTQGTPQIPAMQSKFGNWKMGNDIYGFTSFFRNNAMRTADLLRGVYKSRGKGFNEQAIAWLTLAQFLGNSTVAGMLALGLRAFIMCGPVAIKWADWDEEDDGKLDDWLDLMKKGFITTMAGGPIDFILRSHERSDKNLFHSVTDATIPGAMLTEMIKALEDLHNPGVDGLEVMRRFARRWSTAYPAIMSWLSIAYIAEKNVPLQYSITKFYQFRKKYLGRHKMEVEYPTEEPLSMEIDEALKLNAQIASAVEKIKSMTLLTQAIPDRPGQLKMHKMPSIFTTQYELQQKACKELQEAILDKEFLTDRKRGSYVAGNLRSRKTISTLTDPRARIAFEKYVGDTKITSKEGEDLGSKGREVVSALEAYDEVLEYFASAIENAANGR